MTLDTHNPADAVVIDEMIAKAKEESLNEAPDEFEEEDEDAMRDELYRDLYFPDDEDSWWEDEDELEGDLW